jgi:hypothetical protein
MISGCAARQPFGLSIVLVPLSSFSPAESNGSPFPFTCLILPYPPRISRRKRKSTLPLPQSSTSPRSFCITYHMPAYVDCRASTTTCRHPRTSWNPAEWSDQFEVTNAIHLGIQPTETEIAVLLRGFNIGKVVSVRPLAFTSSNSHWRPWPRSTAFPASRTKSLWSDARFAPLSNLAPPRRNLNDQTAS